MGKFHKILLCKRGVFGCPWINNNARRIKTSIIIYIYSGISKVSGYFCVDVMSMADGRVAPFISVRFRDIRFLHLDGGPIKFHDAGRKKLIRKKVVFTWKMQCTNGSGVIKESA